ncbi:MAG: alpha/beta hydrolase [Nocardiopsaceae bacterium]|jgi:pimeloyl-ACP methyl ester carboxylesterase|nr:alpha/beta hydrolase [Nocardiopsaceae bacterium]
MPVVTSRDGTPIAYDKQGSGPALVVVDGALTVRKSDNKAELVDLLAPRLTVLTYDRRGRGDSGDTPPYSVAREIEDLTAVIGEAGGSAALYGHSSGGCLALEATLALSEADASPGGGPDAEVTKLSMYEAPYDDDPAVVPAWHQYLTNMTAALDEGRPGDAAALFMAFVGTPAEQIESMRAAPFWRGMEAVAPTLAYDHAGLMGTDRSVPADRARGIAVPTLVMHGGDGAPFMAKTAATLAEIIPDSELRTIPGQGHNVSAQSLAPLLEEFVAC